MEETTIEDLPDEVLNLIFNKLNFHGHLRQSSVCRRFFQLVADDVKFMRTVNFRAFQTAIRKLPPQAKLMRSYRTVTITSYDNFEELTDLELELLANAESLNFCSCNFRDTVELVSVLQHCKRLTTVLINSRRIKKLGTEPIETFSSPVSIVVDTPGCQSLSCFAKLTQIHVREWDNWTMQGMARFLSQHAAAVTSMDIYERDSDEFWQLLVKTPQLKLKHLNMYFDEPRHLEQKTRLFAHQGTSLTTLAARGFMDQWLFDVIRSHLLNLETLDLQITHGNYVRLNDLKVMPKLKCLAISFHKFEEEFELDIGALQNLQQLKLSIGPLCKQFKLALKRTVVTLRTLELRFPVDKALLGQIATIFPNLTNLELRFSHSDMGFLVDLVPEINKLVNLRSFESSGQSGPQLINDDFLSALKLPNLRRFHLYDVRQPLKLGRPALNILALNCPKLLRITENANLNQGPESCNISIRFKRLNSTSKFRRVRRPARMENFKRLDYDSMESCTDESDTASIEASF